MKKNQVFLFNEKLFQIIFWGLVSIRAVFNYGLPLMDNTEARYAEIARIMTETQNWIVPHIDYGVPFLAKPPLSTWASAICINIFGDHAFFIRLPYLLLTIGVGLFLSRYGKTTFKYFPGVLLLCIPEFYLHSGVVSTDMFLSFSIGLIMLSFWEAIKDDSKTYWKYLFFLGLALGLLAKGPIAVILTLPPIALWCLITNNIKRAFKALPWILGIILLFSISLPWYYLAEKSNPGFYDYFIKGEHFERYFNPGWKGDKYGFVKQQPFGIIWIFFIISIFPWSILLINLLIKRWTSIKINSWALFLLIWMFWIPVFFTSSKSLIHPYILPSSIPVALFIVDYWETVKAKKRYLYIGLGIPLIVFFLFLSGLARPFYVNHTDKYILENLNPKSPIYSLNKKTYSSQFYTRGLIKLIDKEKLKYLIKSGATFYIRITKDTWEKLDPNIKNRLELFKGNSKAGIYQSLLSK
ncbi:MAG: hypothetical protein CBD39_02360 [Flavobacteriaceae bacterium TMED179]|nr:MAG: hypothetical protein CBD39_02360 [Flavobacteriaceae bacterium TMED179]|tara:strand:- start:7259 stop:8659 length:1401 start_codon:yes stop_codon:yes gene_type:complete